MSVQMSARPVQRVGCMIGLAHADGKEYPNLALASLTAYFKSLGEEVRLIRPDDRPDLFRGGFPERIYGSSIFDESASQREDIEQHWGHVLWGGTGVRLASSLREVDASVDWDAIRPDFSLYPEFAASMGFLTRGCRLRCGFCVVPEKEGRPRVVSDVHRVWRGEGHPRHLHLLDNDAFAKPLRDFWREAVEEFRKGRFRVCFTQGINVRLIDDEAAALIARTPYYGNDFNKRILYTAWDNLRDESIFKAGVERLRRAGVPPHRLRVFMLVGYREDETWEERFYRFAEIAALRAEPYVMVYGAEGARPELDAFQRWSNRWFFRSIAWPDYARDGKWDTRIYGEARADSDAAWNRVVARMLTR